MISIRTAKETDLTDVAAIIKTTLREVSSKYYPTRIVNNLITAYSENELLKKMGTRKIFVAIQKNKIIGTAQLTDDGWITAMFVYPEYQKHGVGTKLVRILETNAKKNGHNAIRAHVAINSVNFYKKLGFRMVKSVTFKEAGRVCRIIKRLR